MCCYEIKYRPLDSADGPDTASRPDSARMKRRARFPISGRHVPLDALWKTNLRHIRADILSVAFQRPISVSHRGMTDQLATWDPKHQRANTTIPRVEFKLVPTHTP